MKPQKWTPASVICLHEKAQNILKKAEPEALNLITTLRGMADADWSNSELSKDKRWRGMRRSKVLSGLVGDLEHAKVRAEFYKKLTSDIQSKDVWGHVARMSDASIEKMMRASSYDAYEEGDKAGTYAHMVCGSYIAAMSAPKYTAEETREQLESLIKNVKELRRGISTSKLISEPLIDVLLFGAYRFGAADGIGEELADHLNIDNVLGALEWHFSYLKKQKQLVKKVNTENFNRNYFVRSLHSRHMLCLNAPKWELLTLLTNICFVSDDGQLIGRDSIRKLIP